MERTAPYRSLTSSGKRPRGIGRAIVERMAEHGAHVVVSSRHVEPCREVAAAINARLGEGRAVAIAANILNEQLHALVEETVRASARSTCWSATSMRHRCLTAAMTTVPLGLPGCGTYPTSPVHSALILIRTPGMQAGRTPRAPKTVPA